MDFVILIVIVDYVRNPSRLIGQSPVLQAGVM